MEWVTFLKNPLFNLSVKGSLELHVYILVSILMREMWFRMLSGSTRH